MHLHLKKDNKTRIYALLGRVQFIQILQDFYTNKLYAIDLPKLL